MCGSRYKDRKLILSLRRKARNSPIVHGDWGLWGHRRWEECCRGCDWGDAGEDGMDESFRCVEGRTSDREVNMLLAEVWDLWWGFPAISIELFGMNYGISIGMSFGMISLLISGFRCNVYINT